MAVRSLTPKSNLGGSSIVAAQERKRAELAKQGWCGVCARRLAEAGFTPPAYVPCFDCAHLARKAADQNSHAPGLLDALNQRLTGHSVADPGMASITDAIIGQAA
jgi:hypothetical protein